MADFMMQDTETVAHACITPCWQPARCPLTSPLLVTIPYWYRRIELVAVTWPAGEQGEDHDIMKLGFRDL
jgi:hypothetical protein